MLQEAKARRALNRLVDGLWESFNVRYDIDAAGHRRRRRAPVRGSATRPTLAGIACGLAAVALATAAAAESAGFDQDPVGSVPAGWLCGSTDGGAPRWTVEAYDSAPSPPNVLMQTGSGSFPWCVKQGTALADGAVEVKFSPLAGDEDRAGGVVWRWKDGDTYYVARGEAQVEGANSHVSVAVMQRGRPRILKDVEAPVAAHAWHTLRVEFKGAAIRVLLDGKPRIEFTDGHIAGEGAVGVWTSADSVTAFDDFNHQLAP